MGYAQTLQQRRRCFIKGAATVAAIFLAASACGAQVTPAGQAPEAAWTEELNKYPGLLEEFCRLVERLQSNVPFPSARGESRLLPLLPAAWLFMACRAASLHDGGRVCGAATSRSHDLYRGWLGIQ